MIHFEVRGKGLALVADCCRLAFGYAKDGKLVLTATHDRKQHQAEMSANDLRSMANMLDWMNGIRSAE
jgi:hypothetical protein